MTFIALAFYLFAGVTVASAFMVIAARNPVHSVLFLILAFFSSAGLFVLIGAEFIAMILVIVYVGAVAVLFLFVVMMLDINFVELRQGFLEYLPVGAVIGIILLIELLTIGGTKMLDGETTPSSLPARSSELTNTELIGQVLYTDYVFLFQGAGMVLLVAMIGAIVLTHRRRPGVKRQDVVRQQGMSKDQAVKLVDVKPGQGG